MKSVVFWNLIKTWWSAIKKKKNETRRVKLHSRYFHSIVHKEDRMYPNRNKPRRNRNCTRFRIRVGTWRKLNEHFCQAVLQWPNHSPFYGRNYEYRTWHENKDASLRSMQRDVHRKLQDFKLNFMYVASVWRLDLRWRSKTILPVLWVARKPFLWMEASLLNTMYIWFPVAKIGCGSLVPQNLPRTWLSGESPS